QATQLQAAQARLPPPEQALAQARNQVAQVLALPPGALSERLAAPAVGPTLPPEVPIGLPGELLRRRPEGRRGEAELHAARARVGVSEAKLFPSVTLAGAFGLQSPHASDLTDWASHFWLGGALISVPIFPGGQLRAQVELAGIDAQRAALAYRQ